MGCAWIALPPYSVRRRGLGVGALQRSGRDGERTRGAVRQQRRGDGAQSRHRAHRAGAAGELKIDAYPFQDFGVVQATVTSIADDAVHDREAGSAYKVVLTPAAITLHKNGKPVTLRSGLTLTADIVTDRRTMLSILLEPFRRLSGKRSAG